MVVLLNLWNAKKMKRILIILLAESLLVHVLSAQTLLEKIENAYNALDSVSYIENIILSYRVDWAIRAKGLSLDSLIVRPTYNHLEPIQRQHIIDSLMRDMPICSKSRIENSTNEFISAVKNNPVHFVLNLIFEKNEQSEQSACFKPDTSDLQFNLISFDKHFKPQFYVFVVWGKYVEYHESVPTFIRRVGKNVRKIYKKILRKNPQYILNCDDLEGGNTIWYVLNDEIYVYRIYQMKEYKLNEYLKKYTPPVHWRERR